MQMYSSNKYKTIPNPCRLFPNSLHHHYLPQHLLGWAASLPEHDQGAQTHCLSPAQCVMKSQVPPQERKEDTLRLDLLMQVPTKDGDISVEPKYQNSQINQLEALANYLQWYDLRAQCIKLIISQLAYIIPISGDLLILIDQERRKVNVLGRVQISPLLRGLFTCTWCFLLPSCRMMT